MSFFGGDNLAAGPYGCSAGCGAETPALSPPPAAAQALAFHLGRGTLPTHEAGLDCRLRVYCKGDVVCGVAQCDTAYGPVILTAKADKRLLRGSELLAGRVVRQDILAQAGALPTESRSRYVTHAAALRAGLAAREPRAMGKVRAIRALARKGDKKAKAFLAMIIAPPHARAGAPSFGAAAMPAYHRPAIAVPGPTRALTAAEHARLAKALGSAVAKIRAQKHR